MIFLMMYVRAGVIESVKNPAELPSVIQMLLDKGQSDEVEVINLMLEGGWELKFMIPARRWSSFDKELWFSIDRRRSRSV